MNINIWKKMKADCRIFLVLSVIGLTASMSVYADGKSDVELYCSGCHGVIIDTVQVAGSGGKRCTQRTESLWLTAIDRMIGKGCTSIPAGSAAAMATYLASIVAPTTTTTTTVPVTTTTTTVPVTTTTTTVPVTTTTTTVPVTTTTTTVPVTTTTTTVPVTTTTTTVPVTTTTTTTTVVTTTTTTMPPTACNTFVNGTTQYPYSGSGSCHEQSLDPLLMVHLVHDQKWCQQHMTHFNSKGNHTHSFPHPQCM